MTRLYGVGYVRGNPVESLYYLITSIYTWTPIHISHYVLKEIVLVQMVQHNHPLVQGIQCCIDCHSRYSGKGLGCSFT